MARKSKNKSNHGMRTHESLLSLTPSSNMNAALIKPKFTPLPSSKFSSRFQTKGTINPITGDRLMKPNVNNPAYKVRTEAPKTVKDPVDIRLRSELTRLTTLLSRQKPGTKLYDQTQKEINTVNTHINRSTDPLQLSKYNTYVSQKATYDTEVSTKARLLTTDTAQFNRDLGIRTVAIAKGAGGGTRGSGGSRGPNRVL